MRGVGTCCTEALETRDWLASRDRESFLLPWMTSSFCAAFFRGIAILALKVLPSRYSFAVYFDIARTLSP
jgi:hypothetical protein